MQRKLTIRRSRITELALWVVALGLLMSGVSQASHEKVPEESCAFWLAKSPSEWRADLEDARSRWDGIGITFGDIQSWRAERAKTEPGYARTVSDVYIRVVLKAEKYIEEFGPITEQEAYQHNLIFEPNRAFGVEFDSEGNVAGADNAFQEVLDRQIKLRSRYEVLRDGLARVYWRCTDDQDAQNLARYADELTSRDIR